MNEPPPSDAAATVARHLRWIDVCLVVLLLLAALNLLIGEPLNLAAGMFNAAALLACMYCGAITADLKANLSAEAEVAA